MRIEDRIKKVLKITDVQSTYQISDDDMMFLVEDLLLLSIIKKNLRFVISTNSYEQELYNRCILEYAAINRDNKLNELI